MIMHWTWFVEWTGLTHRFCNSITHCVIGGDILLTNHHVWIGFVMYTCVKTPHLSTLNYPHEIS